MLDLLLYLIEERGRVVTRDDLIASVWGGRIVSDAALSTGIRSVRKVVGDDGARQSVIKTFHGRGFRFVADLTMPEPAPTVPVEPGLRKPSIAVLPFANLCEDAAAQDYFVDGICDDIISALSRIRWLPVISRNSTIYYKGQDRDLAEIGRDLDVTYALEGSVRKHANRVRIVVRLVEAATGNQIWADRFDLEMTDVFDVQDEITASIVGAIEPQVSVAEQKRALKKPDQNLDAWDFVIRAQSFSVQFREDASAEALRLFDRAIEIDPAYARAHAQKAWLTVWRVHQGWDDPEVVLPIATEAARKAVHYDPEEFWAHIAWGFIGTIHGDVDLMLTSIEQAVHLNPNSAIAQSYHGAGLAVTGQGQRALESIARARRLSPRDISRDQFDIHESMAHFQLGNYQAAADFVLRASFLRPDHVYALLMTTSAHGQMGNAIAAAAHAMRVRDLVPDFSLDQARTACVYALDDDIDRFIGGLRKAGFS